MASDGIQFVHITQVDYSWISVGILHLPRSHFEDGGRYYYFWVFYEITHSIAHPITIFWTCHEMPNIQIMKFGILGAKITWLNVQFTVT